MRLLRREDFYHETIHSHGRHFHTLNFEPRSYEHRTSMDILVKLAGVLPLLPNLRTVKFVDYNAIFSHAESAEIPAVSKYAMGRARAALRKLMGQATTLTLGTESSAISSEDVCSDLEEIGHFPNLTSLHLNVQPRVLPDMAEALKCMSNLLSLNLVLRGEDETADEACEIAAGCLRDEYGFAPNEINPALRHLSFEFYDLSTSVVDLVSTFRASLVHLDLCARKNQLDPDDTGTLADDFPVLETLTVRGDVCAFTSLLKDLEPDEFPRLDAIRYLPTKYPEVGEPSAAPVRIAPEFDRPLRRVVAYNTTGSVESCHNLEVQCDELVLRPALHAELLDFACSDRPPAMPSIAGAVQEALDFVREWYVRAIRQGDDAALATLAKVLSRVELERIVHAV